MNETKQTPGPWRAATEYLYTEDGTDCISVFSTGLPEAEKRPARAQGDNAEQARANARLIAASPAMYDYLFELATSGDNKAASILAGINA